MCNWLPVSTFFNQLWEDVDELLASISGVQLRYLVEHCSPIVECENSAIVTTVLSLDVYHTTHQVRISVGV